MSSEIDSYIKEGMEHKKKGDYDRAEECFKKVLEFDLHESPGILAIDHSFL